MNNPKRQSAPSSLRAWISHECQPNHLISTLTAGIISGVLVVIYSISIAMLIFSGQLAPFISIGLGLVFLNAIIIAPFVGFTNSLPGVIADPQEPPAMIIAMMASEIVSQFPNDASRALPTVIVMMALTTILVGVVFLLLGAFKVGHFIRLIPYPVVGGFIAGAGYLFVQGAFNIMTDQSFSLLQLSSLLQSNLLIRWLPGVGVALTLLILLRRYNSSLILPSVFAGFTALFYLSLSLSHTSTASARAADLLLESFPKTKFWPHLHGAMLHQVDWSLIAQQSDNIATTVLLSVMLLLLTISSLELATQQSIDLNKELRSAGIANLMVGLGDGTIGFHSLSISTLNCVRIGTKSRLVGVIVALICLMTLAIGSTLITFFPKSLFGGVLLYLGLSFLVDWVYDAWFRLPKIDYCIVIMILLFIATMGIVPGGWGWVVGCDRSDFSQIEATYQQWRQSII